MILIWADCQATAGVTASIRSLHAAADGEAAEAKFDNYSLYINILLGIPASFLALSYRAEEEPAAPSVVGHVKMPKTEAYSILWILVF
jgi:hypothetical protein